MDIDDFIKINKKLCNYRDLSKEEIMKILKLLENCEISSKSILK